MEQRDLSHLSEAPAFSSASLFPENHVDVPGPADPHAVLPLFFVGDTLEF